MTETVEPLIADLVEWVSKAPRSYSEVMDAWRTSCPRLTVWEDAVDRGYLVRERVDGGSIAVRVTPEGRKFLAERSGNKRILDERPDGAGLFGSDQDGCGDVNGLLAAPDRRALDEV